MNNKTKPRNRASSRKKKDSWTISELQMWFTSVFDVQGDDWYPDKEQWDKVVDMIFRLKETEKPVKSPPPPPAPLSYNNPQYTATNPSQPTVLAPIFPVDNQHLITNDELPPGIDDLNTLRKQSEAGLISGGNVIKSGTLNSYS